MQCPTCNQTMIESGNFYICGLHEQPVILQKTAARVAHAPIMGAKPNRAIVDCLPTPLAIVYDEYQREQQPFVKLHRLTDTAEMITRFFAITSLSSIYNTYREFDLTLKRLLVQTLSRPSFGAWRTITEASLLLLKKKNKPCFLAELSSFWKETWLPLIGKNDGDPHKEVLALRNMLAHSGRVQDKLADELCGRFCKNFEHAVEGLRFFENYQLIATLETGPSPFKLAGLPDPDDWSLEKANADQYMDLLPKHIYFCKGDMQLSLFPLHAYDTIMNWSDQEQSFKEVDIPSPMMYLRYNATKNMLEYTALGQEKSFSQKGSDFLNEFLSVFNLPGWKNEIDEERKYTAGWPDWDYMFSEMLDDLTANVVGRANEINDVKQWLKNEENQNNLLWINGRPGSGKSAFMAELISRLRHSSKTVLVYFFFREGDHRCHLDYFYNISLLKLIKEFQLDMKIDPSKELSSQFIEAVQRAGNFGGKKILFILDGLDELSFRRQTLESSIQETVGFNAKWVLAGRNNPQLQPLIDKADLLWEDGYLPALTDTHIRTMLQQECELQKYTLFQRDEMDEGGKLVNPFIEELVRRSEGIPLYIKLVIQDIQSGVQSFLDEKTLPASLESYYESLLDRMKLGNLAELLNNLFGILSWAKEPLTTDQMKAILSSFYDADEEWDQDFSRALTSAGLVLKKEETSVGERGWTFYHHYFKEHIRNNKTMSLTVKRGLKLLLAWCSEWKDHHDSYAVRHFDGHLLEAKDARLFEVAYNEEFKEAIEKAFPNEPLLPLKPVKAALELAADTMNAPMITRFFLHHAQMMVAILDETPLKALTRSTKRAINLAQARDNTLLWFALLMWELKERREDESRRYVYDELQKLLPLDPEDQGFMLFCLMLTKAGLSEEEIIGILEDCGFPKPGSRHLGSAYEFFYKLGYFSVADAILLTVTKRFEVLNGRNEQNDLFLTLARHAASCKNTAKITEFLSSMNEEQFLLETDLDSQDLIHYIALHFITGHAENSFALLKETGGSLDEDVIVGIAVSLLEWGAFEEAREYCYSIENQLDLSWLPGDYSSFIKHLNNGETLKGLKEFEEFIFPEDFSYTMLKVADEYFRRKDFAKVHELLETVMDSVGIEIIEAITADKLAGVAKLQMAMQELEAATATIRQMLVDGIVRAQTLIPILEAMTEAGQIDEAIDLTELFLFGSSQMALYLQPKKQLLFDAMLTIGTISGDANDFEKAASYIQDFSIENTKRLVQLAKLEYETFGTYENSQAYKKLRKKLDHSSDSGLMLDLFILHYDAGNDQQARTFLRELVDWQKPGWSFAPVIEQILIALIHAGKIEEAVDRLLLQYEQQDELELLGDTEGFDGTASRSPAKKKRRTASFEFENRYKDKGHERIARAYLEVGNYQEALRFTIDIIDEQTRDDFLEEMAVHFISKKEPNWANQVKDLVVNPDIKRKITIGLLLEQGFIDEAFKALSMIEDHLHLSEATYLLASWYTEKGKYTEASSILESLSSSLLSNLNEHPKGTLMRFSYEHMIVRTMKKQAELGFEEDALKLATHLPFIPGKEDMESLASEKYPLLAIQLVLRTLESPQDAYDLAGVFLKCFLKERFEVSQEICSVIKEKEF